MEAPTTGPGPGLIFERKSCGGCRVYQDLFARHGPPNLRTSLACYCVMLDWLWLACMAGWLDGVDVSMKHVVANTHVLT